jgi:hypothetical protein
MSIEPEKKVVKNPRKPFGNGILRYQILNCLAVMDCWMGVADIEGWLRKQKGVRHNRHTIYQSLYEINIAFDNIELLCRREYGKPGKVEKFKINFKTKNSDVR